MSIENTVNNSQSSQSSQSFENSTAIKSAVETLVKEIVNAITNSKETKFNSSELLIPTTSNEQDINHILFEKQQKQLETNRNHFMEKVIDKFQPLYINGSGTGRTYGPDAFPMNNFFIKNEIFVYPYSVRTALAQLFRTKPALETIKFTVNNNLSQVYHAVRINDDSFKLYSDENNVNDVVIWDGNYNSIVNINEKTYEANTTH